MCLPRWYKTNRHQDVSRYTRYLPPAYVVRREGNSFTLLVCSHPGGVQSADSAGGGCGSVS